MSWSSRAKATSRVRSSRTAKRSPSTMPRWRRRCFVRNWTAERIAEAAGAELVRDAPGSPTAAVIDSRDAKAGQLFVGLVGENTDGGQFASEARQQGAWGSLIGPG